MLSRSIRHTGVRRVRSTKTSDLQVLAPRPVKVRTRSGGGTGDAEESRLPRTLEGPGGNVSVIRVGTRR